MKKRAMLAVFFGILLLGAYAAFALPPPGLCHDPSTVSCTALAAIQPAVLSAEQPAIPATFFVVLVQTRASPVYAVFVRHDGAGFKPGGDRDSVASLSPSFTVLSVSYEKSLIQPLAAAVQAVTVVVFRDINARSPPSTIWV